MEPNGQKAENKFYIPRPGQEVFAYGPDPVTQIVNDHQGVFIFERFDFPPSGGMFCYVQGALYPKKGFPFPEAAVAFNQAKRLFIELLRLSNFPEFRVLFVLAFLPFKRKVALLQKLIRFYLDLVHNICIPYVVKPSFMTPVAQEIQLMTSLFLEGIGIGDTEAKMFAQIFANIIQYDDAYRYRIQDVFSDFTKEQMIASPRKTIQSMMRLIQKREHYTRVSDKFLFLINLLTLALFLPKIRKVFTVVIQSCNWEKLQYDDADRYWVAFRDGYDFCGKTYKERSKDLVMPPRVQVKV